MHMQTEKIKSRSKVTYRFSHSLEEEQKQQNKIEGQFG